LLTKGTLHLPAHKTLFDGQGTLAVGAVDLQAHRYSANLSKPRPFLQNHFLK
jgi:hypothetical protein